MSKLLKEKLKEYNITTSSLKRLPNKICDIIEKIHKEEDNITFTYKGYLCEISRHDLCLHLSGYVYITKEHNLYRESHEKVDSSVCVHGGITWTGHRNNLYGIGFDCSHYKDSTLSGLSYVDMDEKLATHMCTMDGSYRDIDYVKKELKNLVDQIDHYEYQIFLRKNKIEKFINN